MVDRYVIFIITQFISAAIGFAWGFATHTMLYTLIGGGFFAMGVFGATMLRRLKVKEKTKRRSRK
ncbi:MAG: hypothetical protein ACE5J2_05810 [Nitrososphaerales archaeon]